MAFLFMMRQTNSLYIVENHMNYAKRQLADTKEHVFIT